MSDECNGLDLNASAPNGLESPGPMVTYNVDPHKIHSLECDLRQLSLTPDISLVFDTKSINVHVYKADITEVETCDIASSANLHLKHKGFVAAAVTREAGPELKRDCEEYVKKHGALKVTDVVCTTSGRLPCMIVLQAVGPRWGDYRDKEKCKHLLATTVWNCLENANNHRCTTLTFSATGAGKNGIPKDMCAQMYLAAIQRFAQKRGNDSILKNIHFVDINDDSSNHHPQCFLSLLRLRN